MPDLKKEHLLHKIVAGSGFLFALCILPVAQYALTNAGKVSTNSVAGVSTQASASPQGTLQADVSQPTDPAACEAQKQKDLSDLNLYYDGKKQNLFSTYENAVKPYQSAETVLTGTPDSIASDKAALDKLINDQYTQYLAKLSAVDAVVTPDQASIQNRSC